ncbi:MAG: hypothetical protein IPG70_16275 [Moraxellaceae bacterium]|nr:hypothetical protein [Moraxellaceae bacterium]
MSTVQRQALRCEKKSDAYPPLGSMAKELKRIVWHQSGGLAQALAHALKRWPKFGGVCKRVMYP